MAFYCFCDFFILAAGLPLELHFFIDVSEKRNTIQIYNTDMQYRYAILFMLFLFSFFFPNSCADRGSNRENSIEACLSHLCRRLEKGFREGSACQKSILAAGLPFKVPLFYNFSCKAY